MTPFCTPSMTWWELGRRLDTSFTCTTPEHNAHVPITEQKKKRRRKTSATPSHPCVLALVVTALLTFEAVLTAELMPVSASVTRGSPVRCHKQHSSEMATEHGQKHHTRNHAKYRGARRPQCAVRMCGPSDVRERGVRVVRTDLNNADDRRRKRLELVKRRLTFT